MTVRTRLEQTRDAVPRLAAGSGHRGARPTKEYYEPMFQRCLPMLAAIVAAGCASQPSSDTAAPDAADTETPADAVIVVPVEPPDAPSPVAELCEELLSQLGTTRPLLESLDERLGSHAERMEAVVARLEEPPPRDLLECPQPSAFNLQDKEIIGSIEWIYLSPPRRHYRARVDSGTETSSLSAREIVEFERDGDDWVRFVFQHDDDDDPVEIELPVVRTVLIRQMSASKPERRVVVEMDVRLGNRLQGTEFTLADRSNLSYPISLGRSFLMDLYVIDVSLSYTQPRYDAS